jgi:hypothetical protein
MKSQHMNGSCLSALMTSLSSLLGWKGNLIHYATYFLLGWPKTLGVSLLLKTDKNGQLTCLSCHPIGQKFGVGRQRAGGDGRTSAKISQMVKRLQFRCPLWSDDWLDWSKSSSIVPHQLPDKVFDTWS